MRARLLGALLAAMAAHASPLSAAERTSTRTLACAAPTLFQCAVIVPGFDRWFFAPLGIAPSDGEMAARVCREKRLPVASATRRPTGSGPMNQTTALEVICGAAGIAYRPSPAARPARDFEGERFAPARRRDAEIREAGRDASEPPRRSRARAEPREKESAVRPLPPRAPAPAAERKRDVPEPAAPAAASPVVARPAPAAAPPAPKPAEAPPARTEPAETGPAAPAPAAPKPDPSIMYDHL